MTGTLKWGLSPLDYREHLIEEWGNHPIGVLEALCGHRLVMITPLLSVPACKRCEACMAHLIIINDGGLSGPPHPRPTAG
ncbi:MAG: hypothetical protein ACRDTX_28740 [Pseudonocardiaceae bacterium]